jgi:hypothetical protein
MDENLQLLVRELRQEYCPRRVRDAVSRRISTQEPARRRFGYGLSLAATAFAGLCCLAVWEWSRLERVHPQAQSAQQASLDRSLVIEQAENALGFFGGVLLQVEAHSERAIFKKAISPLRNSLETRKDKITHHTKP